MCTTMRKLRRGTPQGKVMKLYKRRITMLIKVINSTLLTAEDNLDITQYMKQLGCLNRLRRSIKV